MQLKNKILVFLAIFVSIFISTILTLKPLGIGWDEPIYLKYNKIKYLKNLSPKIANKQNAKNIFKENIEIPPLTKVIFAFNLNNFFLKNLNKLFATRLTVIFFFSLLGGLLFWFMEKYFNFGGGLFSVLFFILQPRLFGEAHFISADIVFSFFYFLTIIYFYLAFKEKNLFNLFMFFIFFIIANLSRASMLSTILPFILWLYIYKKTDLPKFIITIFTATLSFLLILHFFWHYNFDNIYTYYYLNIFRNNWDRVPLYFLNKSYLSLFPYKTNLTYPIIYPYAMILFTTPIPILFLFFIGLFSLFDKKNQDLKFLLFLFFLWPLLLLTSPQIPKYDGVRLFIPALTILPIFSALGLLNIFLFFKKFTSIKLNKILQTLAIINLLVFLISEIVFFHPYFLSYYNTYVGGLVGAQKKGLELTYWGEIINSEVLNYLNTKIPKKSKIIITPYSSLSLDYYKNNNYLNKNLIFSAETILGKEEFKQNDYLVLIIRQGCFTKLSWIVYNNFKPDFKLGKNKVILVGVYNLKKIRNYLKVKG